MKIINRGQSLFEVVLSLGLAAIIILAVVSIAMVSIKNSSFSEKKTLAAQFAQEATEWLRGERDKNWSNLLANISLCPTDPYLRCLNATPLATEVWANCGSCGAGEAVRGTLRREVGFKCKKVTAADPTGGVCPCSDPLIVNAVEATVRVYWQDAQGYHEVTSATDFSDWRERP